jgi:hypothetical protein
MESIFSKINDPEIENTIAKWLNEFNVKLL